MSLELLISKYIDGELSPSEDVKLRSLLKENPFAKEKFDQSVELHLDLLEDSSSIKVPAELLKRTEEAVLMKILVAPDIIRLNQSKTRKISYRIPALAAMISFFALISIFNFGDSDYPRTVEFIKSSAVPDLSTEKVNLPKSKNIKSVKLNSVNIVKTESVSDIISDNNSIAEKNEIPVQNNIKATEINNTSEILYSEGIKKTQTKYPDKEQILSPDIKEGSLSLLNNFPGAGNSAVSLREMSSNNAPVPAFGMTSNQITSIQLNTNYSTDFARTGLKTSNNTPIVNMSQSIGYHLSDNTTIGLEIGITELSYDYIKYIPLDGGINPADFQNNFGVLTPNGGTGSSASINVPVSLSRQQQLIWGMAFYDTGIFTVDSFSLNGRIGLGLTSDGPLGSGRLIAKYNLFSSLALTLGAEGRLFMLKTPLINREISNISSYGLVYGVQFNF